MNRQAPWIAAATGMLLVLLVVSLAQPPGSSVTTGLPPSLPSRLPPQPPEAPPLLPPGITPVDRFRMLLERDPGGRESELASRNPAQREYLRARLREFDRLSPLEREVHLQALTLRHYFLPLLRADATNRVTGLQAVPLAYRDLVRARLAIWDTLAPDQQRTMLESESVFAGLALVATPSGVAPGEHALGQLPPDRRQRLDADLARWRALAPEQRAQISARFREFLTLTGPEQRKALAGLQGLPREKAARLVERLGRLTPEQQARSIEAFGRFSTLAPAEQERFLANAARWRAMSTEERAAWRRLLARSPPHPPPLPPRPHAANSP